MRCSAAWPAAPPGAGGARWRALARRGAQNARMRRPARAQGAASCAPSHLVGGAPLPTSTQRRRRRRCGLRAPAGGREGRPPSPRRTWRRAQVVPDAASLKVVHKDVIIPRRHMPLSTGGGHERAAPAFNERGASPKSHRHLTENQESLRVLKAAKVTGCCLLWHAEALSCWRGVRAAPTHQARRREAAAASRVSSRDHAYRHRVGACTLLAYTRRPQ